MLKTSNNNSVQNNAPNIHYNLLVISCALKLHFIESFYYFCIRSVCEKFFFLTFSNASLIIISKKHSRC